MGEGGAFVEITCLCQESPLRPCRWQPCDGCGGFSFAPVMCWGLSLLSYVLSYLTPSAHDEASPLPVTSCA